MRKARGLLVPFHRRSSFVANSVDGVYRRQIVSPDAFDVSLALIAVGRLDLRVWVDHDPLRVLPASTLDRSLLVHKVGVGLVAEIFCPLTLRKIEGLESAWGRVCLSAGWIAKEYVTSRPLLAADDPFCLTMEGRLQEVSLVPAGAFALTRLVIE